MMEVRGEETRDGTRRTRTSERGRATPASGGGACNTTESWLEIFSGLLHLPQREKESIRDEIGSHLRERVRDLLLEGYNETNAIHAATRELGDAAELAKKFESVARGRTRRTIMHFAILGTGLVTVATAGIFVLKPVVSSDSNAGVSVFQEAAAEVAPPASVTEPALSISAEMTLREIVDAIAAKTDLGIAVDWGQMEEIGLVSTGLDEQPAGQGLSAEGISALGVLQMLQRQCQWFDWRFRENDLLELGMKDDFDLRERVLASYDIAQTLLRLRDEYELPYEEATIAVAQLITEFVEPELWEDNGGLIAQLEVVGGTLFINAPPRMHEKTSWILAELDKQSEAGALLELQPVIEEAESNEALSAHLSIGDAIVIEIYELFAPGKWFTATRLVEGNGAVRLPVVGDIQAEGKTVGEVEELIRATLKENVIIAKPLVSVYTSVAHTLEVNPSWLGSAGSTEQIRDQFAVLAALLDRQRALMLKWWRQEPSPEDLLAAQQDAQVQELMGELTSLKVQRAVDGADVPKIDARIAALEVEIRNRTLQQVERNLGSEGGAIQAQIDSVLAVINHLMGENTKSSSLPALGINAQN